VELAPLIAGVSEQRLQERIHPEQGRKQQDGRRRDPGLSAGMNDGVEQQNPAYLPETWRFLPLIFFARIIAMRIDAGPPFFRRPSRSGCR